MMSFALKYYKDNNDFFFYILCFWVEKTLFSVFSILYSRDFSVFSVLRKTYHST